MRKIRNIKIVQYAFALLLLVNVANAQQQKKAIIQPPSAHTSYVDSLLNEFRGTVYNSFNNPVFWAKSQTPVFTFLRVDIDKNGKVKNIRFSDSADTLFVAAFSHRPKYHNDKLTLERYAKARTYTDLSIIIPVSYEPSYSPQRDFYEINNMETLMKFDNMEISGKVIILSPVKIGVLPDHNM